MALSYPEINPITERIIGLSIDIHTYFGPGLFESVYDDSLYWDLFDSHMQVERQRTIRAERRSRFVGPAFRADLIVEDKVIVEVKSVEKTLAIHKTQLLTYMKLARTPVGLLINFNVDKLVDGVTRLSL